MSSTDRFHGPIRPLGTVSAPLDRGPGVPTPLRLDLLGPMHLHAANSHIVIKSRQARTLLGVLALARGRVVSSSTLIDALWAREDLRNSRNAMQAAVSRLRRILARPGVYLPDCTLQLSPGGYALAIDSISTDIDEHDTLILAAEAEPDLRRAAALYESALALWFGSPFEDLCDTQLLRIEHARLAEARISALEAMNSIRLRLGESSRVARDLRPLFELHGERESLAEMLMLALYRAGRQTEALDVYRGLRNTLRDEFGVDPGVRVRRLERAILSHDSSLSAGSRGGTGGPQPALG